jgi:hypothetical protein
MTNTERNDLTLLLDYSREWRHQPSVGLYCWQRGELHVVRRQHDCLSLFDITHKTRSSIPSTDSPTTTTTAIALCVKLLLPPQSLSAVLT